MCRDFLLAWFCTYGAVVEEDSRALFPRLVNSILLRSIHTVMGAPSENQSVVSHLMVCDLTVVTNRELQLRGESIRLRPEHVGHTLTGLGITNRGRTKWGMRLWLDLETRRRIHQNARVYGEEGLRLNYGPLLEKCALCAENSLAELLNKVPPAAESESTKSSDPTQNTSPASSPKLDGTDNVARADKTFRRRNGAHPRQPVRSKRRGRAKK